MSVLYVFVFWVGPIAPVFATHNHHTLERADLGYRILCLRKMQQGVWRHGSQWGRTGRSGRENGSLGMGARCDRGERIWTGRVLISSEDAQVTWVVKTIRLG